MMSSPSFMEKVYEYIHGKITSSELEEWLLPRVALLYQTLDSDELKLLGTIELGFAEISDGIISEKELKDDLTAGCLRVITIRSYYPEQSERKRALCNKNKENYSMLYHLLVQIRLYLDGRTFVDDLANWLTENISRVLESSDDAAKKVLNELDANIVWLQERLISLNEFNDRLRWLCETHERGLSASNALSYVTWPKEKPCFDNYSVTGSVSSTSSSLTKVISDFPQYK